MEKQSNKPQKRKRAKNISTEVDKERLKVSILRPMKLLIGQWKFEPTNEGDELVVKSFFTSKQLAWEVARNGCKEKIEIEWSNIVGIRFNLKENEPGTLDVELLQPPKFYKELKVDLRTHNKWIYGSDFTESQASNCRMHLVVFPPRMLNELFERLISSDKRLCDLCQSRYPTSEFAYFPSQTFLNAMQLIQPSNQTLQLTLGASNLIGQTLDFGLPSHLDETIRKYELQSQLTISTEEALQMRTPIIKSSNNFQMAASLSSRLQYSEVSNGYLNHHLSIWPTNFNTASNCDLLNRLAYLNEVSSGNLVNGPTNSNGILDRCMFNGPVDYNGVSNRFLSNGPTHSYGVSKGCLQNGPTNSNGTSNGSLSSGPTDSNGASNGNLLNGPTYSNVDSIGHLYNRPTNSNGAPNGHMFNDDSTYFDSVSNNYFSNRPTDLYRVWLSRPPKTKED